MSAWAALRRHGAMRALGRVLPLLIAALFVALLYNAVRELEWADIRKALGRYEWPTLLGALALSALVHGIASGYDVLGRRHERHAVPVAGCMGIAFVAYAVSISLSAILGTWVLRYRLYARRGLAYAQVTRLALFAIATNWSGFLLLAGSVFLLGAPALPADWPIGRHGLRVLGLVFVAVSLAYPLCCWLLRDRQWQWRDAKLSLPSPSLALAQLLLSAALWASLAAVAHRLMPEGVGYPATMTALFISATAGLLIRVPAGVGVAELVFLTLLGPSAGSAAIVAGLLLYRCVYQLLPLAAAGLVYLVMELRGQREAPSPVAA